MRPPAEGFAVLAVLALLAVVGLYAAATFQDALLSAALASARLHQQRAFELADFGIDYAMQRLAAPGPPTEFTEQLQALPGADNGATVALRLVDSASLPAGFSAGRLVALRYQITSTGRAARGAQSVQVQGVVRVAMLVAPAP